MAQVSVVGVGGIGSWLISPLVRFMSGNDAENIINIYDPDVVEYKNTLRQNFISQDVGEYKSSVIANRYSTNKVKIRDYTIKINYPQEDILDTSNDVSIIIGCVDNIDARKNILDSAINFVKYREKPVIYIDGGNSQISGNVHLSLIYENKEEGSVDVLTSQYFLDMLNNDSSGSNVGISCANMQEQSVIANSRVALEIMNYLLQVSLNKNNILDMKRIDIDYVKEMIKLGIIPYSTFISFRNQYETDQDKLVTMKRSK